MLTRTDLILYYQEKASYYYELARRLPPNYTTSIAVSQNIAASLSKHARRLMGMM